MKIILNLKSKYKEEAFSKSIDILGKNNEEIGKLVPIGHWALNEEGLLNQFYLWRKKFMRLYLAQFVPSIESMKKYILNFSINEDSRIFFGIYGKCGTLFGHIGLSNIKNKKAELDNIIRGLSGGDKELMYYAEKTLIQWAFKKLNILNISAKIISKNIFVHKLHAKLHFKKKESFFLKKIVKNNIINHEICKREFSNVNYKLDVILLNKNDFFINEDRKCTIKNS